MMCTALITSIMFECLVGLFPKGLPHEALLNQCGVQAECLKPLAKCLEETPKEFQVDVCFVTED